MYMIIICHFHTYDRRVDRFAAEDISDQFDKMDKFDKVLPSGVALMVFSTLTCELRSRLCFLILCVQECRSLIEHFQNANRESCHAFETLNARICDQWDDQFKEMSTFASDMEERYFSVSSSS